MRFKQIIEYITIIFISFLGFLAFCFIFIYLARFSFQWYIFERVAETFYYRILAILFGGIVLLSCVNFIVNISIFTKTYFLKSSGRLDAETSFDTKKLLYKTIISSFSIILVILVSLFFLHLSNKYEYHEMMRNKILSVRDHNKKILSNILHNYSLKANASEMYRDFKSLKTQDNKITVIIPLKDVNGKYHYRSIESPDISYDDRNTVTTGMAFRDFFNVESKYFSNYEPTASERDTFDKILNDKKTGPVVESQNYHFKVVCPVYDGSNFILLYLDMDYGEDKTIYFKF